MPSPTLPLNTVLLQMHEALVHPPELPMGVHVVLGGGLPHIQGMAGDVRNLLQEVFRWLASHGARNHPLRLNTRRRRLETPLSSLSGVMAPKGEYVALELRMQLEVNGNSCPTPSLIPPPSMPLFIHRPMDETHAFALDLLFPVLPQVVTAARPLILVADDEYDVRQTTCEMLRELGCDTLEARDGLEAVDRFRGAKPSVDAVLLDLCMPHMDGATAFGVIRRMAPNALIFIASGQSDPGLDPPLEGRPPDAFLHKPFRMGDLGRALRTLLPA